MTVQELYSYLYGRSPSESLLLARQLHRQYGDELRNDEQIVQLLKELNRSTQELDTQMTAMDMGKTCSDCASQEGGGCCSLYMAGECDTLQILMNLLVNIEVEMIRDNGTDCCFLGPTGCTFLFKPMFCLNYNCIHISTGAGKELMKQLEMKSGAQLTAQHDLEKQLLVFMRNRPGMG